MSTDAPTFLYCLGAQKAGTTWLHDYFCDHPDVHVPAVKEMHYFDSIFGEEKRATTQRRANMLARALSEKWGYAQPRRDDDVIPFPSVEYQGALLRMHTDRSPDHAAYRELMLNGRRAERVVADITPAYSTLEADAFAEMLRIAPDAKFLFIMRDPLKRLISSLRMRHVTDVAPVVALQGIDQLCELYLEGSQLGAERRSTYARLIRELEKVVPRAQICYLFYERLFTDATMDALNDWLGVSRKPGEYNKVIWSTSGNDQPSPEMTRRLHATLADEYAFLADRFGSDIPEKWVAPGEGRP
ncbi:MAG: sulfotransferase [Roseicyclus sp.]|nr:sulfotransferase [Roseicyclus sp.]